MKTKNRKLCLPIAAIMLITIFSIPTMAGAATSSASKLPDGATLSSLPGSPKARIDQKRSEQKAATTKAESWRNLENGGRIRIEGTTTVLYVDFDRAELVKSVTETDLAGIKIIDYYAFAFCPNLTSVAIPDSMETIRPGAFSYCEKLQSIAVNPGNLNFSSDDNVLFSKNGKTLVQWPGGKKPPTGAYVIPSSVTRIEEDAFGGAMHIQILTIPESVTQIGMFAFTYMENLKSFSVASGNPKYLSESGVLYNKPVTTLIKYPSAKANTSFSVPKKVATIQFFAFDWNNYLKSITIPANVKSIQSYAFLDLPRLTKYKVSSSNKKYRSLNGILYTKSLKKLITYPEGKSSKYYEVPDETRIIGIVVSSKLKVFVVPSKLKRIEDIIVSYKRLSLAGVPVAKRYVKREGKYMGVKYVPRPGGPKKFKATSLGGKRVKLSWKKGKGTKGYVIWRVPSSGKSVKRIKTIKKASVNSYTDKKGLTRGKTYYYIVDSYKIVKGYKVYCDFSKAGYAAVKVR